MNPQQPFKWRHFQNTIILLNVRWYLRYPLSYRNLKEMMLKGRGQMSLVILNGGLAEGVPSATQAGH
jgi:hypothetical protein